MTIFWENKIGILGVKNGHIDPKIYVFEDFDVIKCNFIYIFAGMEMRVGLLTQYFGHIQVKVSWGANKNSFWGQKCQFWWKNMDLALSNENVLSGVQDDVFGSWQESWHFFVETG